MLNLEVEPTDQPGDNFVLSGEIRRSVELVDSPLILDLVDGLNGGGEIRILYGMRQL